MKQKRLIRYLSLSVACLALLAVLAVQPMDCDGDTCEAPTLFSFPLRLSTLIGIEDPAELPEELTVLVVGVDSRKGSDKVHCDAIHQIHINRTEDTIEFVNVPRGTYSHIPLPEDWVPDQELLDAADAAIEAQKQEAEADQGQEVEAEVPEEEADTQEMQKPVSRYGYAWSREQYISNVCEYISVDEFVSRVDKITGHETDYRVLVGFSQAQGILRVLKMNPTATLQFLRHRQSYGLGDVQRSYNQSVFLEDLLITRFDRVKEMPLTAQAALYQFVDTDMPYAVARGLILWLDGSKARQEPDARITHRTAPGYTPSAQEIHLDPDDPEGQVAELLERLRRYRPGFEVSDVQATLIEYTDKHLDEAYAALVDRDIDAARETLEPVIRQQIWHQIEDDQTRLAMIARLAILDSTVEWYATQSEGVATDLASTLAVSLALEDAEDVRVQIEEHLSLLLDREVEL